MTECMYDGCSNNAVAQVTITDYLGAEWNSYLCSEHKKAVLAAQSRG